MKEMKERETLIFSGNSCSGQSIGIPFMPDKPKLAEAYIPYQIYCGILSPMEGLNRGTVFPELYRPYPAK